MNEQKLIRLFMLIVCNVVISGCVSPDISDLQQYTQEMLARPGGRIEPLPEIRPYEAYTYQCVELDCVDPFQLFYEQRPPQQEEVVDTGLTREMEMEIKNRNREELEDFELDSLKMVGTMEDEMEHWGIVVDPDGIVHRVSVGNYMGRNIGKIVNVFEDRIELREIVRNNQGRWEERQAALALIEQ
ncbi:MAG: pilus assembly protein PilP [Gammaproteobacteria bacterium]|nr:pilus assembly protein PilP [Gammaproteobacteria bacterium]